MKSANIKKCMELGRNEHGGSRICTLCHAQVKSNDADFFQLFNAGIKTWDIEVTQLYKWKCREDQITGQV